jgi:hypothetical protein
LTQHFLESFLIVRRHIQKQSSCERIIITLNILFNFYSCNKGMSGHDESFLVIPGKELITPRPLGDTQDEKFTTTDASEEEERQHSSCEECFSMSREEDDSVQLYPRFDISFDGNDNDQELSIQAACTSSSCLGSPKERYFLRETSSPPPIPRVDEPYQMDKQSLCRSLAWSQDSQEEERRRVTKRPRMEEASLTTALNNVFSFSGFQQNRQPSADSPLTAIHWEEKIVDSMQLISFFDPAATQYSNNSEMQQSA